MRLIVVQLHARHEVDADGHVLVVVAVPAQTKNRDSRWLKERSITIQFGVSELSGGLVEKVVDYLLHLFIHQMLELRQIELTPRHTAGETTVAVLEAIADKHIAKRHIVLIEFCNKMFLQLWQHQQVIELVRQKRSCTLIGAANQDRRESKYRVGLRHCLREPQYKMIDSFKDFLTLWMNTTSSTVTLKLVNYPVATFLESVTVV